MDMNVRTIRSKILNSRFYVSPEQARDLLDMTDVVRLLRGITTCV